MIRERGAVIKSDSNEEHGQTPSETPEHALMAVSDILKIDLTFIINFIINKCKNIYTK